MRLLLALTLTAGLAACRNDSGFAPLNFRPMVNDHGQWLSMTTAPDGRLAMSFYDRTMGAVGFALAEPTGDAVRWEYEKVDGYPDRSGLNPGNIGTHTSLAFSPNGTAWIAYHDVDAGTLKVASRSQRKWTSEVVDAGTGPRPRTGMWTSIAIDLAGQPVVAYHDDVAGDLMIARRAGDQWTSSVAYSGADVGEHVELHIRGNLEYLVFYDRGERALVMLEGFAGAYAPTVVDTGGVGTWPSMHVSDEKIAIAYHDPVNHNLKLAVRDGGGYFEAAVLDDGLYRGADTAIFHRNGRYEILYFDGERNDMRIAVEGEGGIFGQRRLAGETTAVGFFNEVAQDGTGRWWAASYNYTERNIFVMPMDD